MALLCTLILGILAYLPLHSQCRPVNSPLLPEYDYIVVGGGASGLTVANRLTENPDITVLVLEAGQVAADNALNLIPVNVGGNIFTGLNWQLYTTPQIYLNGQTRYYPMGKALGGGTVINGMLWNRGGQDDYNDWVALGNPGWGWNDLLPYFKKSERFEPLQNTTKAARYGATSNPDYHGRTGPVHVSYSKYIYRPSELLFQGLNYLGIPTLQDPNDGSGAGATYLPVDIRPRNQTRFDAKHAYYDPYASRPNLYVSTGQQVTQLIFEGTGCSNPGASSSNGSTGAAPVVQAAHSSPTGLFGMSGISYSGTIAGKPSVVNQSVPIQKPRRVRRDDSADPRSATPKRVIGVEYAADTSGGRSTAFARREVILAAGACHTPQILELSGIGEASFLSAFKITPVINLPGVGNNLQDHHLVVTQYPYQNKSFFYPSQLNNATTYAEAGELYNSQRLGPWTAGPPDGNAFPSLPQISNRSATIAAEAEAQAPDSYLAPDLDATILAGYTAQRPLLIAALNNADRAVYELLNNNQGSLVVSNMRPFARGTVHIQSSNPFTSPMIDPRYGSNPVDLEVLREALLFNRLLINTPPMQQLQVAQWLPGADLNDDQLIQYIKTYLGTEYHSSGTAAMLPLELGGVVDSQLLVYGTSNLRIVDTSIYPLVPAAHLQAVVYAVAEKAADIIKIAPAFNFPATPLPIINATNLCGTSSTTSTSSSSTSATSGSSSSTATLSTFSTMTLSNTSRQHNASLSKTPTQTSLMSRPSSMSEILATLNMTSTTMTLTIVPTGNGIITVTIPGPQSTPSVASGASAEQKTSMSFIA